MPLRTGTYHGTCTNAGMALWKARTTFDLELHETTLNMRFVFTHPIGVFSQGTHSESYDNNTCWVEPHGLRFEGPCRDKTAIFRQVSNFRVRHIMDKIATINSSGDKITWGWTAEFEDGTQWRESVEVERTGDLPCGPYVLETKYGLNEVIVQVLGDAQLSNYEEPAATWLKTSGVVDLDEFRTLLEEMSTAIGLASHLRVRLESRLGSCAREHLQEAADAAVHSEDEEQEEDGSQGEPNVLSFPASRFKRRYLDTSPVKFQHELFSTLLNFLTKCAEHKKLPQTCATQLFEKLQTEVVHSEHWEALLTGIPKVAVILWTSASRDDCGDVGFNTEFCSLLNEVLREDLEELMLDAAVLIRAMGMLVVCDRGVGNRGRKWPEDLVSHRGTSMPREEVEFFRQGLLYRVPMFLATSFLESKATEFMRRAPAGRAVVHFKLILHPELKCDHALYIENLTLLKNEKELLYMPYSAFRVVSVSIPEGTVAWNNPIVIELAVQPNGKTVEEDVPLARWH